MALIQINEETEFFDDIEKIEKQKGSILYGFLNRRKARKNIEKVNLFKNLEQSTSYINSQFTSKDNHPIDLYIVPTINKALEEGRVSDHNTIKDDGGVFYVSNPGKPDPYILLSQEHSLGLDNSKTVSQSLLSSLGQEDFAKTIFYHETGHYLDYLLSQGLLTDVAQNQNLLSTSFLNRSDFLYQNFLNAWQPTLISEEKYDENYIDYLFRQMMKESAADCWACFCLFQEKVQNGLIEQKEEQEQFKHIIAATIQARKLSHYNNPESQYATYNALTRLYYNYKKHKPQTNQDWVSIVQKSIQEGLVLNLQEVVDSNYSNHRKLAAKIIEYKDRGSKSLGFQQQKQNMIDRLKSHKINRRDPDSFTI